LAKTVSQINSSSESSSESSDSDGKKKKVPAKKSEPTNLDLLLSLDDSATTSGSPTTVLTPSSGVMLTPMTSLPSTESLIAEAAAMFVPTKSTELLNKMSSAGLQVLQRFTRSPHLYSPAMCNIQVGGHW
jgi:AP-3 complex subunit beta